MKNARHVRLTKELTLFEVSIATGIEQSRLSKFETDKRKSMTYEDMKTLAAYYGTTIDALLEPAPEEAGSVKQGAAK